MRLLYLLYQPNKREWLTGWPLGCYCAPRVILQKLRLELNIGKKAFVRIPFLTNSLLSSSMEISAGRHLDESYLAVMTSAQDVGAEHEALLSSFFIEELEMVIILG